MKIKTFCLRLTAVLFLLLIFTVGIGTAVLHGDKLAESVTNHSIYVQYYTDDAGFFDKIRARIASFQTALNSSLFGRQTGLDINLAAEGMLGKVIMQFSSSRMVFLNTGDLYDLQDTVDLTQQLDDIITLKDSCDVPFLFVYAHSTLYDDAMLPESVAILDHNNETADSLLAVLGEGGVDCLDSRAVLNASGIDISQLILRTDQHWSSCAALTMAEAVAEKLAAEGLSVIPANLAYELFDSEIYTANFLGKYGQRIGVDNVVPDDMTEFWPSYDTSIKRTTTRKGKVTAEVEGTFREAVIREANYTADAGETYSTNSYKAYGLTESEDHYINNNIPGGRVLIIKDSFGSSVSAFLSLSAHEVWAVDLRTAKKTVSEYIEEMQPDAVVVIYSQQMLRDYDYDIE